MRPVDSFVRLPLRFAMARLDLIVGFSTVIASLAATALLVLVCRNRIERISRLSQPTLREILRELRGS
jgi:hypothetical protein